MKVQCVTILQQYTVCPYPSPLEADIVINSIFLSRFVSKQRARPFKVSHGKQKSASFLVQVYSQDASSSVFVTSQFVIGATQAPGKPIAASLLSITII